MQQPGRISRGDRSQDERRLLLLPPPWRETLLKQENRTETCETGLEIELIQMAKDLSKTPLTMNKSFLSFFSSKWRTHFLLFIMYVRGKKNRTWTEKPNGDRNQTVFNLNWPEWRNNGGKKIKNLIKNMFFIFVRIQKNARVTSSRFKI